MKQRYYVIIALASYLLFTLMNTPAATVISLAEKSISMPVKFYGVQGSIWNGQADQVMIPSQPPLDNLQWSLNPLALLLLSLSADIEAQIKQQRIIGNINIGVSGDISVSDVRAQLNAAEVQRMLAMPFGELGGEFNLDIRSLQWSGSGMPLASGKVIWKNARLTMMESVDLGLVKLDINPGKDDQLVASIKNKNGQLGISGNASLMPNKSYTVDLTLNPQNNASNNVKQSLGMFAKRQSNGSYIFKKSGNLNQLGF